MQKIHFYEKYIFYEKVYFMKPNTSRSANSEKYAVCINFRYNDTSIYFDSFLNSLMMLNNVDLNKQISLNAIKIEKEFINKYSKIYNLIRFDE